MTRIVLDLLGYIVITASVALVAVMGAIFTGFTVKDWYETLNKPEWTPDGAVIGTVWTTLYVAMIVAASIVWHRREHPETPKGLILYFTQLVLMVAWSGIFFAMKSPGPAFAEVLLLDLFLLLTVAMFWKINRVSGVLMGAVLTWSCFASFLNFVIWRMNIV